MRFRSEVEVNSAIDSDRLQDEAKVCRAQREFDRCAELADAAYAMTPSAYLARLKIECLRKVGKSQAREAAAWAKSAQDKWGRDTWFCNSYAWAIYDGYLKFSVEQRD